MIAICGLCMKPEEVILFRDSPNGMACIKCATNFQFYKTKGGHKDGKGIMGRLLLQDS